MYQEIVLSSSFIEFIDDNLDIYDFGSKAHKVLSYMSYDTLVISSEVWAKEVDNHISKSNKKDFLKDFIAHWQQNNKFKKIDLVQTIPKNKFIDKRIPNEVDLCFKTEDKIILRNESNGIQRQQILTDYDVEIDEFFDYLNPPNDSRLLTETQIIEIKRNQEFNFVDFINPYLKNISYLLIQDGYLLNENRSWKNLIDLLNLTNTSVTVKINTLSDEGRNFRNPNPDKFKVYEKIEKQLLKLGFDNFKIQLFNKKLDLHARKIETDKYLIHLGEGLDFVETDPITKTTRTRAAIITIIRKNTE